jgi:hypothetical protein
MIAVYVAYASLTTVFIGGYEWNFLLIMLILLSWIPLIFFFTSIQTSLRKIIVEAKWKIRREIQQQVSSLKNETDLGDKENIEIINELMSFHDRIKGTRDSALNLRSIFSLFNQLLLPTLGYLVANWDKLTNLFSNLGL